MDPNANSDEKFIKIQLTSLRLPINTSLLTSCSKLINAQIADESKNILKEITLDEVSNHDHYNDCWIILYDRVYELTKFLKKHPAGYDVILEYAGRDASLAFSSAEHSESAIKALKIWEIGQLPLRECIFRCNNRVKLSNLPE